MSIPHLQEVHSQFEKAFSTGDLEGLVAMYEPQAMLAPQPGTVVTGTAAIREAYRAFLAIQPAIQVETLGTFESGEGIAMLHGHWVMTATLPDGSVIRNDGHNSEVLRRQADGGWLFLIDNPFSPPL
jgi:uncharacterized protein (TIGR02246 family)